MSKIHQNISFTVLLLWIIIMLGFVCLKDYIIQLDRLVAYSSQDKIKISFQASSLKLLQTA